MTTLHLPVLPPVSPMLAKAVPTIPEGALSFEPKWDGFRSIVFRSGPNLYMQSRDLRPLDRYFPDLHQRLLERLPDPCVLDGEIVITTPTGLSFDLLQDRSGRVQQIYQTTGVPESFLLDRDGVIIKRIIGAHDWSSPANRALVERLLDEPGR